MTYLDGLIRETIRAEGPISVARFMQMALQNPDYGYYVTGNPIGAEGDFITSPEISQMFGELIGLWSAQMWLELGSPSEFTLLELGPGRGTLMADALRASARVTGFHAAMRLCLLETSDKLRAQQRRALTPFKPHYLAGLSDLPPIPVIAVANEFFDALPVHQYRRTPEGWREVLVGIEGEGLSFQLSAQPVPLPLPEAPDFYEVSPLALSLVQQLAAHIAKHQGAGLIVDYGYQTPSGHDTLQAVQAHRSVDPLEGAGTRDLTAHVDFSALRLAVEKQGAFPSAVIGQGDFLRSLGIDIRARQLKMSCGLDGAYKIEAELSRLTDERQMGSLFKALAFSSPQIKDIPGFP